MPLVNVTFVRHGESTDNLTDIWAGWKDAPLSNHGMNQARAAGEALSSTHFTAIYSSTLLRAHATAQAIQEAQLPSPKPPLTTSPLLREQHFGIAEGKKWSMTRIPGLTDQEHFDQQLFPVLTDRNGRFPEGESLNDLSRRANQALDEIIFPHIYKALKDRKTSTDDVVNIALVSHGLCISEMVAALVRRDSEVQRNKTVVLGGTYSGLLNTAWTRASIDVPDAMEGESSAGTPPALKIQVIEANQHKHLESVKRQKGGIGSSPHDPNQSDIRKFFGGGKVVVEEGRSKSNARDEVDVPV